jgi:hypothetical protein
MDHKVGAFRAVYKPCRGERPLWDFPTGTLGMREAAAFEVSRALGWDFVPPTIFREDGPLGPGSFQEYLALDFNQNYFTLRDTRADELRQVAVFDCLINNADRKALHIVADQAGCIRLIDHGLCFHVDYKLRTVVWEFAGETIPDSLLCEIHGFRNRLGTEDPLRLALRELLSWEELIALEARALALEQQGKFLEPGPGRNIPWPIMA